MNRRKIVLVVVLFVIVMLLVPIWLTFMFPENPRARSELLDFYQAINLGDSKQSLNAAFVAFDFKFLDLVPIENDVWLAETPYELGATNWVIYIVFRDEIVHEKMVRTYDSPKIRPPDAPADVAAEREN